MNQNEIKAFWESKYREGQTGWDIGAVSLPIKTYIDQIENKNLDILIPGAGRAYEAEYLLKQGFQNVHVLDIARDPLAELKNRVPHFKDENLHCENFFTHQKTYDLILEQTFFCAIDPTYRKEYVQKAHSMLNIKGKIAGLLFDFPLTEEGPPYGGSAEEYINLFEPYFHLNLLERSYNSIKPRWGRELFFIFEKKN
ncbi:SAM-dependent methyltransferase [Namhaeicola litoreus]|uniref:SAM-dependent methyltransferase n=1 Tax=Namhaeicola litoreus TaxID=1052145 RepID=A0ABW3Y5W9_9FLAO